MTNENRPFGANAWRTAFGGSIPTLNMENTEGYLYWCQSTLDNGANNNRKLKPFVESIGTLHPAYRNMLYAYYANPSASVEEIAYAFNMSSAKLHTRIALGANELWQVPGFRKAYDVGRSLEEPSLEVEMANLVKVASFDDIVDEIIDLKDTHGLNVKSASDAIMRSPTDFLVDECSFPIPLFDHYDRFAYLYYKPTGTKSYSDAIQAYYAYKFAGYLQYRGFPVKYIHKQLQTLYPKFTNNKRWFKSNGPTGSLPDPMETIFEYGKKNPKSFSSVEAEKYRQNGLGTTIALAVDMAANTSFAGRFRNEVYQMNGPIVASLDELQEDALGAVAKVDRPGKTIDFTNLYIRDILLLLNDPKTVATTLNGLPEKAKKELLVFIASGGFNKNVSRVVGPQAKAQRGKTGFPYSATPDQKKAMLGWIHAEFQKRGVANASFTRWNSPAAVLGGVFSLVVKVEDLDDTFNRILTVTPDEIETPTVVDQVFDGLALI